MNLPKELRRVERRQYYERNAEKIKAGARAWSAANPDRKKATRDAYYEKNKETISAKSKAWAVANPEKNKETKRAHRLKTKYGISNTVYEEFLIAQGNRCAICNKAFASKRSTHVDHSHFSGQVRSLLCVACNTALGHLEKQGGTWFAKAQMYLSQMKQGASVLEGDLWRSE